MNRPPDLESPPPWLDDGPPREDVSPMALPEREPGDESEEIAHPAAPAADPGGSHALTDAIGPAMARFRRRADGIEKPIPLPWVCLGNALGGGLWPGVSFLVGSTGTFKTAIALEVAAHAADAGIPVLYIGLELGPLDLVGRLVGLRSGVRWSGLWNGEHTNREGHALIDDVRPEVLDEIAAWPFRYVVGDAHGWDYTRIHAEAVAMRARWPEAVDSDGKPIRGSRPFLMVLDYLQIVGSPPTLNEELRERIRCASYAARAVARDLDAVVLVVSSTSRENAKRLTSDEDDPNPPWSQYPESFVGLGKESGEIEYSADTVLVLFKEHAERGQRIPLHVAIAKCRAGQTSWCALRVEPRTLRIEEMTHGEREDEAFAEKLRRERKDSKAATNSRAETGETAADLVVQICEGLHDEGLDRLKVDGRKGVKLAAVARANAIKLADGR